MNDRFTIKITKTTASKLKEISWNNLPFGKYFTDHMLEADYINGAWTKAEIKPFQSISLSPSVSALHYGQAIFEGIKAFRGKDNSAYIFRPHDNHKRFNISARRLEMATVPEEIGRAHV